MLRLQKENAEARLLPNERQARLKNQIDELDREIDRAVYALYDLTETEIRTVERKA